MKIEVSFDLLEQFVKQIKKDCDPNGDDFLQNYFVEITVDGNGNSTNFNGSYDCPPIYFHYRYAADTNWKLIKCTNFVDKG